LAGEAEELASKVVEARNLYVNLRDKLSTAASVHLGARVIKFTTFTANALRDALPTTPDSKHDDVQWWGARARQLLNSADPIGESES
jgi:hypothetical protein